MDREIILSILEKIPTWAIITYIFLYYIHKLCDNNMVMFIKLLTKWKVRDERKDRIQDAKILSIERDVKSILEHLTK